MISISIIIPIYNVEQYISRCVRSIIDQDNSHAIIECLFVDDCSSDNSIQIVHSIVDQYNGNISFRILTHTENKGLSVARNTGIEAAKGDYILFVDPDDWLPKDSISYFLRILKDYPSVDMISGNSFRVVEKRSLLMVSNEIRNLDNYQLRKSLINHKDITHSAWNKLIKASIVAKYRFQEGVIFEDIYWSYLIFKDIKQAIIIPDITYVYENNHPASIINTARTKHKAPLHIKSISVIGNSILDILYQDLYIDSIFFLLRPLVVALRLQYEYRIDSYDGRQLKSLRKRIIRQSAKDGRWFLSFFVFVLLYLASSSAFNMKWVRRHYDTIETVGRHIVCFFDRFNIFQADEKN
jgi:glycosyltransferase involved in cell wall biosynthesis